MKTLINGNWVDRSVEGKTVDGSFKRHETTFRNWITQDGTAGPSGQSGFEAESERYHLYVSLACPWAHRTLIMRLLKDLSKHVTVSVVHPLMKENGWELTNDYPSTTGDSILGKSSIYEIYLEANSSVTSRASVPVLWDKKRGTIVSNESAEIIRMFNSAFDGITKNTDDYYPAVLRSRIDAINTEIYNDINNGVYKTGFSSTQSAYTRSVRSLFAQLDQLEKLLSKQRYLLGDTITEADWRLFPTLVRFDSVYVGHFKCNIRCLTNYPNLWAYTRDLYQTPGISETVDFDHIKTHYYSSHAMINPFGIIPEGPIIDFSKPHNRDRI